MNTTEGVNVALDFRDNDVIDLTEMPSAELGSMTDEISMLDSQRISVMEQIYEILKRNGY